MQYEGISYFIAGLIIIIGLISYIADLARTKGRNPIVWVIVCIITFPIGFLILWLMPVIVGKEKSYDLKENNDLKEVMDYQYRLWLDPSSTVNADFCR